MKALLLPDLHCYPANYGHVEADGVHSRLSEWHRCSKAVTEIARERKPDLIVAPGDYFPTARPSPTQVLTVAGLLGELSGTAPVVGCAGNHDLVGAGQPGPVALVDAMTPGQGVPEADAWGIEKPVVISRPRGLDIAVAVLPAVKPAGMLENGADPAAIAQRVSDKLVEIARAQRPLCNETYNILVGHWTIAGSVSSSGQVMVGGTEPAIPLAELKAQGWDAVLFGHIHKPQVLSEQPFIGYAGNLLRQDFGEAHDPRGVYLIDLDAGTHEFIPVPARRFVTYDLDEPGARELLAEPIGLRVAIEDAIVRVTYRATEHEAKTVDHAAIIEALSAAGAEHVASVFPEIVASERARAEMSEATGPMEALGKWLELRQDLSPEVRVRVTGVATELLREVA